MAVNNVAQMVPSSIRLASADGETNLKTITTVDGDSSTENHEKVMKENEGISMINSKGSAFPMIDQSQIEDQRNKNIGQGMEDMSTPPNRSAGPVDRNVLVNNPNNPQPPNKVSANTAGRESMYNNMAMDPGTPFPQPEPTPPAPTFPQGQGTFAMYDGPEFNAGLKNAMKGKEGKFADMVADAPGMYDGLSKRDPSKRRAKKKPVLSLDEVAKRNKERDDFIKSNQSKPLSLDAFPERGVGGDEEEDFDFSESSPGMYNKAPGMHEKHTQISKANVNSAMKDNAAHISYLKRDINYDNKHGGSNKSMTSDEKHISKLAGDIKYDVKKKRKYDNV